MAVVAGRYPNSGSVVGTPDIARSSVVSTGKAIGWGRVTWSIRDNGRWCVVAVSVTTSDAEADEYARAGEHGTPRQEQKCEQLGFHFLSSSGRMKCNQDATVEVIEN
jgi:hypothetical protein